MSSSDVLRHRSQTLRKEMTLEERILWYHFLRKHPFQWNRQKVLGAYIVDFYCKTRSLVIELDGSQHYDPESQAYDLRRTQYLQSLGLTVLRFTNTDIKKNLSAVCEAINQACTLKNLPSGEGGPPRSGGG